jgi:ubiquinone/menaquinone biosynthesis C-methylase UbiE
MPGDDFYDSLFGRIYSAYMERPRVSRPLARLLWGGNTRPYYESMAAIGEAPAGGTIVDCPCGAGPALRALSPGADVRYVAADLSPAMLRRARVRAGKRGLNEVEFIEAKAEELPLEEDSADLFLSYWGIHVFPDPRAAVAEIARVLKPGGRLVGSAFVRGDSLRQRLMLRPNTTDFGPMCTEPELLEWLAEAGLRLAGSSRSGVFMFFEATLEAGGSAELGDQQP